MKGKYYQSTFRHPFLLREMNERREKGREGGRKEGWKEKRFCKRHKDKRQLAPGLRGRK